MERLQCPGSLAQSRSRGRRIGPFQNHSITCAQVFFIRDGFKFPDLVHALRPNPANNIQEAWRFLDFLSYHPESAHMVSHPAHASSGHTSAFWTPSQMISSADVPGIPVDRRRRKGRRNICSGSS